MKRWHILLTIGLAGLLSLLLAPFERLAPGQDLSFTIRVLMLVQPAILTIAAVATGQALAGKLGGHLPFLFAITVHPQPLLIVGVLLSNFIPGLLFGWLFWRRGLEAAMLSHAFAHCVNAIVS